MQMLVSYACSYNLPLPPHSLCPGHPPTQCSDATYLLHTACFTAYFTEDILLLLTLRTMLRSCYISRAHCTSLHMSHYCTLHTLHTYCTYCTPQILHILHAAHILHILHTTNIALHTYCQSCCTVHPPCKQCCSCTVAHYMHRTLFI